MKIAFLASNLLKIDKSIKKGTEISFYTILKYLTKRQKKNRHLHITAFTSENSVLPVPVKGVHPVSSSEDKDIGVENSLLFELSLFSRAFAEHKEFDLYHVHHNNNADLIFPFGRFIKKPIIVTLHGNVTYSYKRKYFDTYRDVTNVHFVTISNHQKKYVPHNLVIKNIYHGIDTKKFAFDENGSDYIMWAGRNAPEKGLDTAIKVIQKIKRKGKIFPIIKQLLLHQTTTKENSHKTFISELGLLNKKIELLINFNLPQKELITHYQTSKLFLFPIRWEEPFGFVMAEAMSCGTPVVAFARGSTTEIIKDGVTGFLVNPSDDDIRGDFIIKTTGVDGLCEAIERIYSLPENKYKKMRKACREHVETNFTVDRMIEEYIQLYKDLMHNKQK